MSRERSADAPAPERRKRRNTHQFSKSTMWRVVHTGTGCFAMKPGSEGAAGVEPTPELLGLGFRSPLARDGIEAKLVGVQSFTNIVE